MRHFTRYQTQLIFDDCLKDIDIDILPGGVLNIIIQDNNERQFVPFNEIGGLYILDYKELTEYPDDADEEELEEFKQYDPVLSIEEADKLIKILIENDFIEHVDQTEYDFIEYIDEAEYALTKSIMMKLL